MLAHACPLESVVVETRQTLLLPIGIVANDMATFGELRRLAEVDQLIVVVFVIAMHDTAPHHMPQECGIAQGSLGATFFARIYPARLTRYPSSTGQPSSLMFIDCSEVHL